MSDSEQKPGPAKTVGEMIDCAVKFEDQLAAAYADIRERAESDGVRLLTHYLARHRLHLPQALKHFSPAVLAPMRRAVLPAENPVPDPLRTFCGPIASDIAGDELLALAIDRVGVLADFYRWLVAHVAEENSRSFFEQLLQTEENHLEELHKLRRMNYF